MAKHVKRGDAIERKSRTGRHDTRASHDVGHADEDASATGPQTNLSTLAAREGERAANVLIGWLLDQQQRDAVELARAIQQSRRSRNAPAPLPSPPPRPLKKPAQ